MSVTEDLAKRGITLSVTPAADRDPTLEEPWIDKVDPPQVEDIEIDDEIWAELERAERHGKKFASLHEAYAVILEEVEEVWEITKQKRKDRDAEALRKELIQIAAMAIKAIRSMENFTGGAV